MKQKRKIFWKVYWVLFALGFAAVITVLIVLGNFLSTYESAQPQHKMEEILVLFQEHRTEEILQYDPVTFNENCRGDIIAAYEEKLEKKEITYTKKYGEYSDIHPVYSVWADDTEVAKVYLCPDEKRGKFNSKIWEIEKVTGIVNKLDDIEIVAMANQLVEVNGTPLTESQIVSSEIVEDAEHYGEYISDFPQSVTYHVGDIYKIPEVKCYTKDKSTEIPAETGEFPRYTYGLHHEQDVSGEMKTVLDSFVHHYVNYCMNEESFDNIRDLFIPGTSTFELMEKIKSMSKWSGKHDRIDIDEIKVTDYVIYSEDAYKVTLDFNYTVRLNDRFRDNPTRLTLYYGVVDGKWKIVEMKINSNYN